MSQLTLHKPITEVYNYNGLKTINNKHTTQYQKCNCIIVST